MPVQVALAECQFEILHRHDIARPYQTRFEPQRVIRQFPAHYDAEITHARCQQFNIQVRLCKVWRPVQAAIYLYVALPQFQSRVVKTPNFIGPVATAPVFQFRDLRNNNLFELREKLINIGRVGL